MPTPRLSNLTAEEAEHNVKQANHWDQLEAKYLKEQRDEEYGVRALGPKSSLVKNARSRKARVAKKLLAIRNAHQCYVCKEWFGTHYMHNVPGRAYGRCDWCDSQHALSLAGHPQSMNVGG